MSGQPAPDASSSGDYIYRTEAGELRVWLAAPMVMVFKYKGHSDATYVDFIEPLFEQVFGDRQGIHVFVDCEEQTSYDAAFRARIVGWFNRVRPRIETYCLLVKSRLVAIGVMAVNLAVGARFDVTSSRSAFRSRLEAAVQSSLASPPAREAPHGR